LLGDPDNRPSTNTIGCSRSPNPRHMFQSVPKIAGPLIDQIVDQQEERNKCSEFTKMFDIYSSQVLADVPGLKKDKISKFR